MVRFGTYGLVRSTEYRKFQHLGTTRTKPSQQVSWAVRGPRDVAEVKQARSILGFRAEASLVEPSVIDGAYAKDLRFVQPRAPATAFCKFWILDACRRDSSLPQKRRQRPIVDYDDACT